MYGPHLPSKTQNSIHTSNINKLSKKIKSELYKKNKNEEPELTEKEYLKLIYNDYNGSIFNSVSVQNVKYTHLYQLYIQFFNKVNSKNSKNFNDLYEKISATKNYLTNGSVLRKYVNKGSIQKSEFLTQNDIQNIDTSQIFNIFSVIIFADIMDLPIKRESHIVSISQLKNFRSQNPDKEVLTDGLIVFIQNILQLMFGYGGKYDMVCPWFILLLLITVNFYNDKNNFQIKSFCTLITGIKDNRGFLQGGLNDMLSEQNSQSNRFSIMSRSSRSNGYVFKQSGSLECGKKYLTNIFKTLLKEKEIKELFTELFENFKKTYNKENMHEAELIRRFIEGLVLISKNGGSGEENFDLGWFYTTFYKTLQVFFTELMVDLDAIKNKFIK